MTQNLAYELSQGVRATLADRGFPFPVEYGPERLQRESFAMGVVFERDRDGGDTIVPVRGVQSNPRGHRNRAVGITATAYVQSSREGATVVDHEELCDQLVDALVVAIDEWVVGAKSIRPEYSEARYLRPDEIGQTIDTWPGCVYRLKFRVLRGITRRTFEGAALTTGEITAVDVAHGTVTVANNADTEVSFGP